MFSYDEDSFSQFLQTFVLPIAQKAKELNQVHWVVATTANPEAAQIASSLEVEYRSFFCDRKIYQKLLEWKKRTPFKDPLLQRQLNVLIREFKGNMISRELMEEISRKESELEVLYAQFRPQYEGKEITENEIKIRMKEESDIKKRQEIWDLSKQVGEKLGGNILELVHLRNQAAKQLGYNDFFQMMLDLHEVDQKVLSRLFEDLSKRSAKRYHEMIEEIEKDLSKRFSVDRDVLGPWAWADPFCQEDPMQPRFLDSIFADSDLVEITRQFYKDMDIDISPIIAKSDLFERKKKNQHAFCLNVDREKDIRVLANIRNNLRWMDTILHEYGHASYDLFFEPSLPWLLRTPPHMITTEAMALLMGRQAYHPSFLKRYVLQTKKMPASKLESFQHTLARKQLILSRWVLVMHEFEEELYRNPDQDLNTLWWDLVERYQQIRRPSNREGKADWAAKYHIGLAPVYYYSYLVGDLFASALNQKIKEITKEDRIWTPQAGQFLKKRVFLYGDRKPWNRLIEQVLGNPLSADAWLAEFATEKSCEDMTKNL